MIVAQTVAQLGVVAGEAENVVNAQHGGAQQVGLQRNAVAVAAGQLENGVQARILQHLAGGKAAQTHDGGLVVGYVDEVDAGEVLLSLFDHAVDVDSLGRTNLGRNYKFPVLKQFRNFHISITPDYSDSLAVLVA